MKLRVALLVDLATSFGRRVLEGVHSHPDRQNWELLAESWGDVGAADLLVAGRPEGIIFDSQSPELLEILARVQRPLVDLTGAFTGAQASSVTADYDQVGQLAALHLRERGFTQVGYLGLLGSQLSAQIERAFLDGCSDFANSSWTHKTPRDWSGQQDAQRQALTDWLAALPRPCGVLAADDVAARRLLQACRKLAVRVPEDLGLIGVGDYEMVTFISDPNLTSVVIPAREIGYQAAQCLADMFQGEPARQLKLPVTSLAARRSTDLLAFESGLLREALHWMREHLAESVRIPELASYLCVSRRLLEQHFQDGLGHGPAEQLRRLRLRRAERLLRETELGLASVAKMSGLGSAERLCVLFRQHLGLTPGEYRRLLPPPGAAQVHISPTQLRK